MTRATKLSNLSHDGDSLCMVTICSNQLGVLGWVNFVPYKQKTDIKRLISAVSV